MSKRLALMEQRLGVLLVNRRTRRMSLTPEGELYLVHARRILGDIQAMESLPGAGKGTPTGLLRVNATLGFGRSFVVMSLTEKSASFQRHDRLLQDQELSDDERLVRDAAQARCQEPAA